jgi:DNA-directed RNA polymerase subunit E'/Rpb7
MPCNISNIKRRITLNPEYLDSNIRSHLLNEIRRITTNECNKEFGHILKVSRIVEIEKNNISSASSDIVFTVVFEAMTLKPTEGDRYNSKIVMILSNDEGVLVNVMEKFMVIIPSSNMVGFIFENIEDTKTMKNTFNDRIYRESDMLNVEIQGVKYENKVFSCFGSLVEHI